MENGNFQHAIIRTQILRLQTYKKWGSYVKWISIPPPLDNKHYNR